MQSVIKFKWWEWLLIPVLCPLVFCGMLFVIKLERAVRKQANITEQRRKQNERNY